MELSFNLGTLMALGAKVGWGVSFIFLLSFIGLVTSGKVGYDRLSAPAPATDAVGELSPPIEVVANRSTVTVAAPVVLKQNEVTGDANVAGRDQTIIGQQILNFYRPFEQGSVSGSHQRVQVSGEEGPPRPADVWVLWNDASWYNDEAKFNDAKLEEFFASSRYQAALKDAGAIACVGLASSRMKEELRKAPDRDDRMQRLSDKRARVLCAYLAEQTRTLKNQPLLLGMGLGFNEKKAGSDNEERKQRAVVLVHIGKVGGTRPASKAEAREVVLRLLSDGTLNDLRPRDYSQVQNGKSVCWFTMEEGETEVTDCK